VAPPWRRTGQLEQLARASTRVLPRGAAWCRRRGDATLATLATGAALPSPLTSMPLAIPSDAPTLLIRREAFERVGLTRSSLDERLNLTPDEFRVEGAVVAVGPLVGETALDELFAELEGLGLVYYDDFFELSGNWPEWVRVLVLGS